MGVIDKAVAILHVLQRNGLMTLSELQVAAELPRATAHRLATALEEHGLVRRDGHVHAGRHGSVWHAKPGAARAALAPLEIRLPHAFLEM